MFLKKGEAATILLGPFVDSTGTPQTSLTISASEVLLSKNGGDFAAKHDDTDLVNKGNGYYLCSLDATDTSTYGKLEISVQKTGCLPFFRTCYVVNATAYRYLFSDAGDNLDLILRVVQAE